MATQQDWNRNVSGTRAAALHEGARSPFKLFSSPSSSQTMRTSFFEWRVCAYVFVKGRSCQGTTPMASLFESLTATPASLNSHGPWAFQAALGRLGLNPQLPAWCLAHVSQTLKEKRGQTPEGLQGGWPDLSSGSLAVGKIPPPHQQPARPVTRESPGGVAQGAWPAEKAGG